MGKMTYKIKKYREKDGRTTADKRNENIKIYILDINIMDIVAKYGTNQWIIEQEMTSIGQL